MSPKRKKKRIPLAKLRQMYLRALKNEPGTEHVTFAEFVELAHQVEELKATDRGGDIRIS